MREMVLTVGVENFTIRYFRTQGEIEADGIKTRVFGICAEKYIGDVQEEASDAGFISSDMAYVDGLITTLGSNTVTPMTLCEVLDDIVV